jgi:WXG100 family type VII secretion target
MVPRFTHSEPRSGAHSETRSGDALVTEHDNLQQFLLKLKADWNSNASISYDDAQRNWDQAADQVYEVLRNLYVALGHVHNNYLMTDDALAKQWNG